MAFGEVRIIPGIDVEKTATLNEAGISDGNLIRWRQGLIEKIGGWVRFYPFLVGTIPRDLLAWQDINAVDHLAIGGTTLLGVITSGQLQAITPQTTTTNTAPDFTTSTSSMVVQIVDSNISDPTTNNSVFIATPVSVGGIVLFGLYPITAVISTHVYQIMAETAATSTETNAGTVPEFTTVASSASVNVKEIGHGLSVGEQAPFLVSTSVGGTTVFGAYLVQTVVDVDNYTISVTPQASANATALMNNGDVRFIYYIALGPQPAAQPYGSGLYGAGAYGYGIAGPAGVGTPITAIDWTQVNWGEILLSCPQGGGIYQWSPDGGFQNAQLLSGAPISNNGIILAAPFQIVMAYGSSFNGVPNPLAINWCTTGDYTNWTPLITNTAGGYQISSGSTLVGALSMPLQQLFWTDIDVWSATYVGPPNVFGFNKIMSGCGLIGSHARGVLGTGVYWMSQEQFFVMGSGGTPVPIPCSVWDYIFQDLDTANAYKIRCRPNSLFGTIAWEFPSLTDGTGENTRYVEYTPAEHLWNKGAFPVTGRSAWTDQSVLGSPIGATPNGLIFQHEMGYNGDGASINPYITTGYFVIAQGEDFCFLDQFLPDFRYGPQGGAQTATILITFYVVDYPGGTVRTYGPYTTTAAQTFFTTRLRGRQVAMQIQSADSGSFWRVGLSRYRFSPDGRR